MSAANTRPSEAERAALIERLREYRRTIDTDSKIWSPTAVRLMFEEAADALSDPPQGSVTEGMLERRRAAAVRLIKWARSLGRINSRRGDTFFSEQELLLREAAILLNPPEGSPTAFTAAPAGGDGDEPLFDRLRSLHDGRSDHPAYQIACDAIDRIRRGALPSEPSDGELLPNKQRIDWLNEQIVNVIVLDDGRIIDARGNDVRPSIDAAMREAARRARTLG